MKKIHLFCISALLLLLAGSCAPREKFDYFQGNAEVLQAIERYTPVLQPDDLLVITVSALDPEATLPFNQANPYMTTSVMNESITSTNPRLVSYLIDENGEINFPVLGKVKIAGMTRAQAMDMMKAKVSRYIKNPSVNINLINFRVTILGEVTRPGTFTIANEKITLPEAIGLAGDLTIYGERKNVLVVRETGGEKTFHTVDLTSKESVFSSPVYYLNQNDIVYVTPNGTRRNSSQYGPSVSVWVSIASLVITVISVLTR